MSVTCPNCQCYFNPVNDDIHSVPSRPSEIPAWVADFINRRAAVESEMMSAESADKEQLRKWALRLGVPSQYGNGLHDGSVKGEKS